MCIQVVKSAIVSDYPQCRRASGGKKAVSKPKSFLEIQQEQEVDIYKQATVSAMTASLSGKATQKPKVLYDCTLYF